MPIPIVVQRPHYINFSKNRLLWRFYLPDFTLAGTQLDFKLTLNNFESTNTSTQKTYQTQVKPNSAGFLDVYVEDIVDSMIDTAIPVITGVGNVVGNNTHLKQVSIEFRQINDATPNPSWIFTESTNYRYVVKGGVEQLKADYNNYFLNYHANNKPFATWQPKYRLVGLTDNFYMSILFKNFTADTTDRILSIIAYWVDGSSNNLAFSIDPTNTYFGMYNFFADADRLGINAIAAGRQLWKYTIQIVDSAVTPIYFSELYVLEIDYRNFYNTKTFHYINSLGGVDHVRILGDTEEGYNRAYSENEKFNGNIIVGTNQSATYGQSNFTRLNSFKSDVGLRHTPQEILAYQELLTSPLIWEVVDGKNIQVFILNKNESLIRKTNKRWGFPIEWRYGFTEQVYTPPVSLGTGQDVEVYTSFAPPQNLQRVLIPQNGPIDPFWRFSCDVYPNAVSYILGVRIVGSPTWDVTAHSSNIIEVDVASFPGASTWEWFIQVNMPGGYQTLQAFGQNFP
jgi:hypothetical protein